MKMSIRRYCGALCCILSCFGVLQAEPIITAKQAPILPIQRWVTHNHVPVLFVRAAELPMVDIAVVFDAGSARDGKTYGIAQMVANALDEGAGKLNADQIANQWAATGAVWDVDVGRDMTILHCRTLTQAKFFKPALHLFQTVLLHPTFPEAAIARLKQQAETGVRLGLQNPAVVAQQTLYRHMYGNHPYAHPVTGTVATIKALDVKQLKTFYQRYYVQHNALIVMVGDLSLQQAKQLSNRLLKGMALGQKPKPLPAVAALTLPQTIHIPFDATQTTLVLGQPALKAGSPDFYAMVVANNILGQSGGVSMLATQVRDQLGYAYSASSRLSTLLAKGPLVVQAQTRTQTAASALVQMQGIIDRLVLKGPTQKQLALAKKNLIGRFPLGFATNLNLAQILVMMGFYHLPLNYLQTYQQKIAAVSLQDVKTVLKKILNPANMVVVSVGKS